MGEVSELLQKYFKLQLFSCFHQDETFLNRTI
jgi:hypothetical protein